MEQGPPRCALVDGTWVRTGGVRKGSNTPEDSLSDDLPVECLPGEVPEVIADDVPDEVQDAEDGIKDELDDGVEGEVQPNAGKFCQDSHASIAHDGDEEAKAPCTPSLAHEEDADGGKGVFYNIEALQDRLNTCQEKVGKLEEKVGSCKKDLEEIQYRAHSTSPVAQQDMLMPVKGGKPLAQKFLPPGACDLAKNNHYTTIEVVSGRRESS